MLLVDVSRARPCGWTVELTDPATSARVALVQLRVWRRTIQIQASYRPDAVPYALIARVGARLAQFAETDQYASLAEVAVAITSLLSEERSR